MLRRSPQARAIPSCRVLLLLFLLVVVPTGRLEAQWKSAGVLKIPPHNYSFLASTPRGDLLAATFNNSEAGAPPRDIPAVLVKNPSSPQPEVVELCRYPFESQRGYGGIACDPSGAFFVSGDGGNVDTGFVRKLRADGTPDTSFGNQGEVRPGRRCLGVEVVGQHLLLAVDWGSIQIYTADTGMFLGAIPRPDPKEYLLMRDIAIDPKSMRLFGVAQGSVVTWGRGAPWSPAGYQFRRLSQAYGQPRATEGISIDPILRRFLITPVPGNTLFEIDGSLSVQRTPIETADPTTDLTDSVMSFDGTTLYVSDQRDRKIHVLKREVPNIAVLAGTAPTASSAATPAATSAAGVAVLSPTWHRSYTDVVQKAREAGKPMLVYFRRDGVKKVTEFETKVIGTQDFNLRAQRFVCVVEDVSKNPLTAQRFGAYRVPYVALIDRNGESVSDFNFEIDPSRLYAAMEGAK
jgi:hypothetical protein